MDVIKIDVEGFEVDVLEGARRLLAQQPPPIIVFEFCDWAEQRNAAKVGAAQQLLLDFGYCIWRLSDFSSQRSPLSKILTEAFAMLVAAKLDNSSLVQKR